MKIGSFYQQNGMSTFTVWAPRRKSMSLEIVNGQKTLLPMHEQEFGYWHLDAVPSKPGTRYQYLLDNSIVRPDPASHFQPQGVHGPSEIVSPDYIWHDSEWKGISLEKLIIYELHTGTFSSEGTFDGIIKKLDYLNELGITAIELMPVNQFPGERNWGYDGAFPFAVQNSYGGVDGLRRLVDQAHKCGIAVIMDVVYNHMGPEGTYLDDFGYYFSSKYNTPWGAAINFDDAWSDGVRNFFIQNALYWFEVFHIDALRLDAIHGIYDFGGKHFLRELAEKTEILSLRSGWKRILIAESDLNDIRVITPFELNGYGIDAQWNDDFHHAIISLITGERKSYYGDFGEVDHLVKAYTNGFVYSWDYSKNRKRHHGTSSVSIPAKQLVACLQNHDQIGNRLLGERISMLVSFDALKLLAGALFVSPYIPLLFMGEEFAADTPFMYFISHGDPELVDAVRRGRAKEFESMHCNADAPDPQSEDVFNSCKLDWNSMERAEHRKMFEFYKQLISFRKSIHPLSRLSKSNLSVVSLPKKNALIVERAYENSTIISIMNFNYQKIGIEKGILKYSGQKLLDSSDQMWLGKGSNMPLVLYSEQAYELEAYQFVMYKC